MQIGRWRFRWIVPVAALAALMVVLAISFPQATVAQQSPQGQQDQAHATETGATQADPEQDLVRPAQALAPNEVEALRLKILEKREATADRVNNNPTGGPRAPKEERGTETTLAASTEVHGAPNALVVGRNNRNSRASAVGSTLAEPVAANDGIHVFYGGNTHFEFSTNGGSTWTPITIPAGPADAPFACCDPDVQYDQARG